MFSYFGYSLVYVAHKNIINILILWYTVFLQHLTAIQMIKKPLMEPEPKASNSKILAVDSN
jgi:hypothetical protein